MKKGRGRVILLEYMGADDEPVEMRQFDEAKFRINDGVVFITKASTGAAFFAVPVGRLISLEVLDT